MSRRDPDSSGISIESPNLVNSGNTRSVFSDDDEFWQYYNQLNSQYRSQLDPYLQYTYKPGWKDTIRNSLGMRSNMDSVRESAADRAWQMLASLQNDEFQNTFNSAQAQAARERDAGLNPDLTGTGDSDPAAGMEQPTLPPAVDFMTPPASFVEDLLPVIQSAAALCSAGAGMKSALAGASLAGANQALAEANKSNVIEDIAGRQISNYQGAHSTVKDYLRELSPETWQTVLDHTKDGPMLKPDVLRGHFDKFFKDVPPEAKKYLDTAFNNLLESPSLVADYYSNRGKAVESRFNSLAKEGVYGSFDIALPFVEAQTKELRRWQAEAIKLQIEFSKTSLEWQNAIAGNGLTLEQFRQKYNVPEKEARGNELSWLANQEASRQEKRRLEAEQRLLNRYEALADPKKNPDPVTRNAAAYYLNQLLVRASASLVNKSTQGDLSLGFGLFKGGIGGSTQEPLSLYKQTTPWHVNPYELD